MSSKIKDSGQRRQFSSGAVRDIAQGKGRMDLLPLEQLSIYFAFSEEFDDADYYNTFTPTFLFSCFHDFMNSGSTSYLYSILDAFVRTNYPDRESAILDLSIHYEQGAQKYKERNWEQGIPTHCYVDSALRHGVKFLRGDNDEPHGRAFMWNVFGLLWTLTNKPSYDNLPYNNKED